MFPSFKPKVLIVDVAISRPRANSASRRGKPIKIVEIRKTSKKPPPPLAKWSYIIAPRPHSKEEAQLEPHWVIFQTSS